MSFHITGRQPSQDSHYSICKLYDGISNLSEHPELNERIASNQQNYEGINQYY